ncbi:DNA-deoxyinosine glycosylase [Alcaligenaceae bacterium C4P045]|nr:DNA-deoxyinosine glycosylase [Alcaligenaceae bacterium C4P045]
MHVVGFPPVVDDRARVLVLGSMPGVRSLDADQYYAHPRNAFWPIVAAIFGFDAQSAYTVRIKALQAAGVALWDVLERCDRPGSLDAAIVRESIVANDIGGLLTRYPSIDHVVFNGGAAASLYARHVRPGLSSDPDVRYTSLPSTSPAHAAMTPAVKAAVWRAALTARGTA